MSIKKTIAIMLTFVAMCLVASFSYARGWTEINGEWYFIGNDGEKITESIKSSDGFKFYLDENGVMVRDYLLENYNESTYYFNDDGYMVSNTWVAVDPSQVSNPIEDGPTVYLYYFGSTGKAYKASNGMVRKTIDGKKYAFDEEGRMLSGWFNASGEMFTSQDINEDPFQDEYIYYGGDETDGVLREGWYEYLDGSISDDYYKRDSIWFYFNPSSNKKVRYDGNNASNLVPNTEMGGRFYATKKINGQTYAFDENGVMLIGWEAEPATKYFAENKLVEGQMAKKQWVFAIPPKNLPGNKDYDDEVERWFYASKSGDITKSIIKKINGKDYVFDNNGIMKTGLVVVDRVTRDYVATINIEGTDGKNFMVDRVYEDKDTELNGYFHKESQIIYYFENDEWNEFFGARQLGEVTLAFGDKDYIFVSERNGEREGLKSKEKKYYHHGIRLIPDDLMGYGIVLDGYASPSTVDASVAPSLQERSYTQYRPARFVSEDSDVAIVCGHGGNEYYVNIDSTQYGSYTAPHWTPLLKVVSKDGKKIKKGNTFKKDKNGNYWIIGNDGNFIKVVSVPVKYSKKDGWMYRSEKSGTNKNVTAYIPFGQPDVYNRTVTLIKQSASEGYDVVLDEQYALNFKWVDE